MKEFGICSVWWEENNDKPSYIMCERGITVISDVTRVGWDEKLINVLGLYSKTLGLMPGDKVFGEPWNHRLIAPPFDDTAIKSAHVNLVSNNDEECNDEYISWECQLTGRNELSLQREVLRSKTKPDSIHLHEVESIDVSSLKTSDFVFINGIDCDKIIVLNDRCGSFNEDKYCKLFPVVKQYGITGQVLILTSNPSVCNSLYNALDKYLHDGHTSQNVSLMKCCANN